jgi:plasmid maintenance system antidote protein VapI
MVLKNGSSDWLKKRTMRGSQLKMIAIEWEVTQSYLGQFLGRSERTLRRMIAGDTKIRPAEALLLNSMIEHGERPPQQ